MTMAVGFQSILVTPIHPLDGSSAELETNSLDKPVRAVSFQEDHETRIIENASKLSKKEKFKRWISPEEFAQFKQDCIKILKETSQSDDGDAIFTYRGLEMVDPAATAKRQRHNTNSVAAVLIAQREQRQKGKCKPKELRKTYKSTVMDSMKEAIENAYLDSKAVQDYLANAMEEVEREHRGLSTTVVQSQGKSYFEKSNTSGLRKGFFGRRRKGVDSSETTLSGSSHLQ